MLMLSAPDLESTAAIAGRVAQLARPGDIVVLAGEMGAGKTTFAKSFGAALGVTEPITSPTFTLVHAYPIDDRRTLHHADLYRLESTAEVDDLALHELAAFGGIVLVEWGDVAGAALGPVLEIRLEQADDDDDLDDDDGLAGDNRLDLDGLGAGNNDDDDFGLNGCRNISISSIGGAWVPRWDRLASAVAEFRTRAS